MLKCAAEIHSRNLFLKTVETDVSRCAEFCRLRVRLIAAVIFCVFLIFAGVYLHASPVESRTLGTATYRFERAILTDEELADLHGNVSAICGELAAGYGVNRALPLEVVIAHNADYFGRLTGNSRAAAVYDRDRRILYLQRTKALERSGNIDRVLRHEISHAIFDFARGAGGSQNGDLLLLEESYLEFRFPANYGAQQIVFPASYALLKKRFMSDGTAAKDRRLYALWGKHLAQSLGEQRIVDILCGRANAADFGAEYSLFIENNRKSLKQ